MIKKIRSQDQEQPTCGNCQIRLENLNLIGQLLCSLPQNITSANEIQDWSHKVAEKYMHCSGIKPGASWNLLKICNET